MSRIVSIMFSCLFFIACNNPIYQTPASEKWSISIPKIGSRQGDGIIELNSNSAGAITCTGNIQFKYAWGGMDSLKNIKGTVNKDTSFFVLDCTGAILSFSDSITYTGSLDFHARMSGQFKNGVSTGVLHVVSTVDPLGHEFEFTGQRISGDGITD